MNMKFDPKQLSATIKRVAEASMPDVVEIFLSDYEFKDIKYKGSDRIIVQKFKERHLDADRYDYAHKYKSNDGWTVAFTKKGKAA